MAFINIILFALSSFAVNTSLLELLSQNNIRYSSKQNNLTIYTKGLSTLAYSTSTSAAEIMRYKNITSFSVIKNPVKNLFLIAAKENDFVSLSSNFEASIYLFNLEDKSLMFLGNGLSAKFNSSGDYLSFYSSLEKKILFRKLIDIGTGKEIQLNAKNPLFIPEVEIINDGTIYFTDINNNREIGILKLDINNNKRETISKTNTIDFNIELASNNEKLYILESTLQKKGHCFIFTLSHALNDISKREILFDSQTGSCHQIGLTSKRIFFIKNIDHLKDISELLYLEEDTSKTYIISDLKFVQNYYMYDNIVNIFFRDHFYSTTDKEGNFVVKLPYKEEQI